MIKYTRFFIFYFIFAALPSLASAKDDSASAFSPTEIVPLAPNAVFRDFSIEGLAKTADEDAGCEGSLDVAVLAQDIRIQRLAYLHRVLQVFGDGHYLMLDDGSVWQMLVWFDDPSVFLVRSWKPGDIVEFHTDGGHYIANDKTPFEIKNQSNGSIVQAWLDLPPSLEVARLIIDIDPKGRFLMLDDGSYWTMSWWQSFSSEQWNVGDRVFVSSDFKKNHYILYNVEMGGWKHTWVKASLQLK